MPRPVYLPDWAEENVMLPHAKTQNKMRPEESIRKNGVDANDFLAAQELNYQFDTISKWLEYLDDRITTTAATLEDVYPVGSLYFNSITNKNPNEILGFGDWVAFGRGRVLVGAGTTTDDNGVEKTFDFDVDNNKGGEFNHILSIDEMPSHTHAIPVDRSEGYSLRQSDSGSGSTDGYFPSKSAGSNQPHNNIQPYIIVNIWQRNA